MNTVSSSSSYSTSAATNKGMSGLVSNMDTEGMVESLLSGTQKKIDKQNASKQVTTWKQEFYREIITNINSFQSTYFGSSSSTSLMSASFFNTMSAVTKSEALSVTASSKAATGKTEIQVGQLATAAKLQSGSEVSGKLTGTIDLSALDRTVVFNTDSGEVKVDLTKCSTTQDLAKQLSDSGISAEVDDKTGKLVVSGKNVSVSSKSSSLGMQMLGVSAGSKAVDGKLTMTTNPSANAAITVSLDGVDHKITLTEIQKAYDDAVKAGTSPVVLDDNFLRTSLQKELDFEFGSGAITVNVSNSKMEMTTTQGREIVLSGDKTTFQLFGIEDGQSNKIAFGQQLQDVGFQAELQGSTFKFKINDVDFEFSNTSTVNDVINKINSSKANVRITYSQLEDKFTIESAYAGAGYDIKMEQTEGNLLNALFGGVASTGTTVTCNTLTTNSVSNSTAWDSVKSVSSFKSGSFKLTVDGKDFSIFIPQRTDENGGAYTRDEVMNLVNEGLANRFGYIKDGDNDISNDKQAIQLTGDGNVGYKLEVRNGSNVSFGKTDGIYTGDTIDGAKAADAAKSNFHLAFGFENVNNIVKSANAALSEVGLSELKLNDGTTEFASFNSSNSIQDVIDALVTKYGADAASFNTETGKISIKGTGILNISGTTNDNSSVSEKLFGTNQLSFGAAQGNVVTKTEGQNALVTINGVDTERSSNTFTVNGLTVSLSEATGSYEKEADGSYKTDANGNKIFNGETASINTTRSTDKIYEGIKSFVEAYNKLIGNLNKKVDEEASFRKYSPLTSNQKKDMSDKEVELWEEKAKTGLLRNDMNINSFLSSMRSALYSKPANCDFALYQVGIETSSEWEDKGKLVIDESKLKNMIETNSKDLETLFTDPTDGLAVKLQDAIQKTANTNSSNPGTLVSLAGVVGKVTEFTNTMTKELRSINSRIADLQEKYEKERARYWKMFNSMESTLSNLNTQSSWLYQQFS